jgi:hypothetical protein
VNNGDRTVVWAIAKVLRVRGSHNPPAMKDHRGAAPIVVSALLCKPEPQGDDLQHPAVAYRRANEKSGPP